MFDQRIICCYLYPITKYGYPPSGMDTLIHAKEMKELGFQSIELEGIREDHLKIVYDHKEKIKNGLKDMELLAPYFCAVLPGLSAEDDMVRKHNLDLFRKGCEVANSLGSIGILDNGPLPPWNFPDDIPVVRHYDQDVLSRATISKGLDWNKYWENLIRTYQEACDIASEFDLTYQIHPAKGVLTASPDGFLHFAKAVDKPNLRFNFDTANLFAIQENLQLALIRTADYVDYIHVSDNSGDRGEHLPIGVGKIDWNLFAQTLNRINFNGYIGIDVGGAETEMNDLDLGYINSAESISKFLNL